MQDKKNLEDLKTNRLMVHLSIGFLSALVLVFLSGRMSLMNVIIKGQIMQSEFYTALYICLGVASLLFLLSLVYLISSVTKKKDTSEKILPPSVCLLWTALILLGLGGIYFYYQYAVTVCYIVLLSFCAIYLVKNVYGRDFYLMSYGLAVSIAGFYILNKIADNMPFQKYISYGCIVLLILLAVLGALLLSVRKKGGQLGKYKLLEKNTSYWPLFLFLALNFAGVTCVLFLGAVAAYYAMFVMIGYTMAAAVYYTVRLMLN